MPAQLREQSPSCLWLPWGKLLSFGRTFFSFCQKLFSRSVQSQISDCFHSLPVLRCISLHFSVRGHYFFSILFLHVITPKGCAFFFIRCCSSYHFHHHTSCLVSHFCNYLDVFPYSPWFHLCCVFLEYFQHLLKNFDFFFFNLLFNILLFLVCTDGF